MERAWRDGLVPSFLAMTLWGGWAFYVNFAFGLKNAVVGCVVQGVGSFIITMTLTGLVSFFFHNISMRKARLVIPPLASITIIGMFLVGAHWIAGTPALTVTVLPSLTLGLLYSIYCTIKEHRFTQSAIAS